MIEVNKFLKGHKVMEVIHHFAATTDGGSWCFCIKYILGAPPSTGNIGKPKVDYMTVLEPPVFERFSKLRAIRKTISEQDAVPAYAILTDEELASVAKVDALNKQSLAKVEGIGAKKLEKYGDRLLAALLTPNIPK